MLTKASVENTLKNIMNYGARPLSEFNKFEALEMVENLHNISQEQQHQKHSYYRTVYHTLRGKMSVPTDQYGALVLRLLGDKDTSVSLMRLLRWKNNSSVEAKASNHV